MLIFVQKAFWRPYFQASLFSEGLIIVRNFVFENWLGLTTKTATTNYPWAYIREDVLLEGFFHLRFGGGGGGGYFREGSFVGGGSSEFYGIFCFRFLFY